jgi:hypothetical protein
MMTRHEKRSIASHLAQEYGAPFKSVMKAVEKGVHLKAVALADASQTPGKAFVAAVNVLGR